MNKQNVTMEDIISLAKRRGFIYPGSDVYGGLSGTWDFGPYGVALKRKIMQSWWNYFVDSREDMLGVDAAILMNQKVWKASGHVDTFSDPLVEDTVTKQRFRADTLLKDAGHNVDNLDNAGLNDLIVKGKILSPNGNPLGEVKQFNMMFKTNVGPVADDSSVSYLRPETAQGIFTNYRNVVDSFYPDLPFGIAQQGKAFRNEISPRDFIFRSREFEQMEIEYFVDPKTWEKEFESWLAEIEKWLVSIGLDKNLIHRKEVDEASRAHYSKRTVDFEFDFPIGKEELLGVAYRTDFDLMNIQNNSGKSMAYRVKGTNEQLVPHVIEPSFGVERLIMAVFTSSFKIDEVNDEKREYLALPENLAPIRYAVSPLLKNKPELVLKAREVYQGLKNKYGNVLWDDNGNIGKRYRRQDEIGTPYCVVVDFQSLEDSTVTVRDRNTTEQKRVNISDLM
jgi:glycyl-tRNA synthetase